MKNRIERTFSQLHGRTDGKIEKLTGTSNAEQAIKQLKDVLHDLELASRLRLFYNPNLLSSASHMDVTFNN